VADASATWGLQEEARFAGAPGLSGARLRVWELTARLSLGLRF